MRTTTQALIASIAAATPVYAATGEGTGIGLITTAFIFFVALIVVFQLVPAVTLFVGMLKGLFPSSKPTVESIKKDANV